MILPVDQLLPELDDAGGEDGELEELPPGITDPKVVGIPTLQKLLPHDPERQSSFWKHGNPKGHWVSQPIEERPHPTSIQMNLIDNYLPTGQFCELD